MVGGKREGEESGLITQVAQHHSPHHTRSVQLGIQANIPTNNERPGGQVHGSE